MLTVLLEQMVRMMLGEIKEVPYNRDNYIIRKKWWIEHYMKLCNQEVEKNKKMRKNNGHSGNN
jgi:hypothetical protein